MKKIALLLLAAFSIVSCDLLFNKDSESFSPANDIEITAIETTPVAKQGEVIAVDVTVRNSGIRNVDEQIEITLSNQTEGVTIGNKTLTDGLASNDSATVSYSWDTSGLVFGEHVLVAKHTFKDNNIANDSLMSILKVIEPDNSDIAISAVRLPAMIVGGEVINAEVNIKNIGNRDVDDAIGVKLNDLTDGTSIGTRTINGGLAQGDSTTLIFSWDTQGYSIGNHELSASHDFDDENPSNNQIIQNVTVSEETEADIAITSLDTPSNAIQGELIEVSVTIQNVGSLNTDEDFQVTLQDQTDNKQIASKSVRGGLNSNNRVVVSFIWDSDKASIGEHTLMALHNFNDDNTTNNSRTSEIIINEAPVTDIAVISLESSPDDIMQGESIEISVTIRNIGSLDTDEDFQVTLQDQTDNKQIASKSVSGGLDVDNMVVFTFIWDTDQASIGEHTLMVRHDFNDDNAANNSRTAKVTVNQAPITDIAIVEINGPSSVTQGEDVELTIRIKNEGDQDVGSAITVTLVDQSDGTTIRSQSLNSGLNAGATGTLTFTWNTNSASIGNHVLVASHDLDDDMADNDSKSITVRINEPIILDIAITDIDAPGSIESGDKITIKVTLQNQGNRDVKEAITVTLIDQTDGVTIGTKTISKGMKKGASIALKYSWDTKKVKEGDHRLAVSHNYTDDNAANNSRSFVIVVEDD